MRIISAFHDYYDTASAYGIDQTVIYHRTLKIVEDVDLPGPPKPQMDRVYQKRTIHKFAIGFCGIVYPIIHVKEIDDTNHYLYSTEEVARFLADHGLATRRIKRWSRWHHFSIQDLASVEEWYKTTEWQKLSPLFSEYKSPIFIYGIGLGINPHRSALAINPKLLKYKFMRIKDPATAFQEIYMYISGVLGVDAKPMVAISDKDKQAAKGHDGEYSFKKPPGGGRWR